MSLKNYIRKGKSRYECKVFRLVRWQYRLWKSQGFRNYAEKDIEYRRFILGQYRHEKEISKTIPTHFHGLGRKKEHEQSRRHLQPA